MWSPTSRPQGAAVADNAAAAGCTGAVALAEVGDPDGRRWCRFSRDGCRRGWTLHGAWGSGACGGRSGVSHARFMPAPVAQGDRDALEIDAASGGRPRHRRRHSRWACFEGTTWSWSHQDGVGRADSDAARSSRMSGVGASSGPPVGAEFPGSEVAPRICASFRRPHAAWGTAVTGASPAATGGGSRSRATSEAAPAALRTGRASSAVRPLAG